MTLTCRYPGAENPEASREQRNAAKANKIYVETTISQDGRNLDGFWLDWSPTDLYALYLLTRTLDDAPSVKFYWIFDENGLRTPVIQNSITSSLSKQQ